MPPRTVGRGLTALSAVALLGVSIVGLPLWPAAADPTSAGASTPAPSTRTSSTRISSTRVPSRSASSLSATDPPSTTVKATSSKTISTSPATTVPTATVPAATVPAATVPPTTVPPTTVLPTTTARTTGTATSAAASGPDLTRAVHYLATTTGANGAVGTSLARNGYYEAFPPFADFGLTIDGAFALAATGTDDTDLRTVVDFFRHDSTDGAGNTADSWTGIGTSFASGGSVGKEAVLAEVTGYNPRDFGGHDLIAALDHLVCRAATGAPNFDCAGAGNYEYATSTFSQSLGVIAQLRAGDAAGAARAIAYLESLQNQDGAWPSLLPSGGDSDVDSTAMAAMALALLPHDATATAAVDLSLAWIAGSQQSDGGFTGAAGESANSTGLAIQGLLLAGTKYGSAVARARHFLVGQQNSDGGFQPSTTAPPGSDVRASTQAVSGTVGTSFGTLSDDIVRLVVSSSSASSAPATAASRAAPSSRNTTSPVRAPAAPAAFGSTGALASTGLNTTGLLGVAFVLLLAGGGLMGLARRRPAAAIGRHR